MLGKKYSTDKINLDELSMHNGIEHDASLVRKFDIYVSSIVCLCRWGNALLNLSPDVFGIPDHQPQIPMFSLTLTDRLIDDVAGEDTALEPDQSKPHVGYITELLSSASGKDKLTGERILTAEDLSKFSSKRRADARKYNKDFSLDFLHKIFGSTK
jgi:hypothetical protein